MAEKIRGIKRILQKDLVPFTKQMASMNGAGMSILTVMQTLEEQAENPEFKKVLKTLLRTIEGGDPLSKGLAKFPKIFDDMFVNMTVAGEQSGQFATIMKRLADILQNSSRLKRKVKSAMTYPTVIMSIALLLCWGLIQFVVPTFAEMFAGSGKPLPALTQSLVDLADFIKNWWYVIIPCIERNGVGALRAYDSFLYAKFISPVRQNQVSFDNVVKAMKMTGDSLSDEYKETSLGGLAHILKSK